MRRRLGQGNLVEGLIGVEVGANATLDRIAAMLNWPALEAVLADIYAAPTGRPSYPVGLLLRALLLQAWHTLSDPAAEAALADRLSFRRFLGVGWMSRPRITRRCGASASSSHGAAWTARCSPR